MTALEQVIELKKQGMSDEEIASSLKQQGISPKEITDAINQANIKNAVAGSREPSQTAPSPPAETEAVEGSYAPATEEVAPGETPAEYTPASAEYPQESQYPAIDTNSIIEISSQVFAEKSEKIQKQLDSLSEFKTLLETKINSIDDRLKRIERIIDNLQIKILEKVSLFGRSIESTKKEVSMLEGVVEKIAKKTSSKTKKSRK